MSITIEGYERFRPIGRGGFSQVYEARQIGFDRKVAVKVLTLGTKRDLDRAAFEGECRAMGSVSEHPNIVTVFGSGFTDDGMPFICMELYSETLLDRIRDLGHVDVEAVLDIGVQLAGALQRAHEARLLHRDIKPQNIFYSQYGDPVLGDFGIAALAHEQDGQRPQGLTLHYAAPEVLDGAMPSVESDIYSLGATLYTALAGHRPFARPGGQDSETIVMNRVMTESPPPIGAQPVPRPVERTIVGLMAKHPNDRPRAAVEVGTLFRDLQTRLGHAPTPLRLAATGFDDDMTKRRDRSGKAVVQPASGSPTVDPLADDPSGDATVYQARDRRRPTTNFAEPPPDRRWVWSAAAIAVVVTLGAIGYLITRPVSERGGAQTSTTTVTAETTTAVIDNSPPPAPTHVRLVADPNDRLVVSWDPVAGAVRYRIDFVTGDLDPVLTADETHTIDTADTPVCLTVVAVNSGSRLGAPSELACSELTGG